MPSRAPSTSLHASKTTTATATAAAAAAVAIMRGSPSPMATTKATPAVRSHVHRDSAYYSNASRSSASGSGGGGGGGGGAGGVAGAAAMDQNLLGGAGRLPTVRQPKTLGRRLSEYFKPPRREVCV
ncbi:hypothetical protein E4U28_000776 [Claviceps purpurea]|nr:hypothetical protein E4U28_000776 [Claviceps purpurea]